MNTFRFAYPQVLWLLALLPLLIFLRGKKGPAPALVFSTTSIARAISDGRKSRPGRVPAILRLLTLALLVMALARPQFGNTTTNVKASGIDILLAVDVSGSMEARDFTLNGQPTSRLEVVKTVVSRFIRERPNDRIGLVAFAGRPYLVCPLTLDHDWLQKRLDTLKTGMIEDGTAIGSAIASGTNRLRRSKAKSRILILLTDGMNNAGKVAPLTAAEAAETMRIKVYTIGAGTRGEAPMPVVDAFGRKRLAMVRVDIDEETLRQVAARTGAQYFRATNTKSLEKIYKEINKLETTTRKIKHFSMYRELFGYPVLLALLLVGVELVLTRRRLP